METRSGTLVARRHDPAPSLVNRWVRKYRALGEAAFDARARSKRTASSAVASLKEVRALERESAQLKKVLAETWIQRGYPVTRILLRIVQVSRSTYYAGQRTGEPRRRAAAGRRGVSPMGPTAGGFRMPRSSSGFWRRSPVKVRRTGASS